MTAPAPEEPAPMIDEVETPHAHHGQTGIKWLDLSLAVAVLVLSGASLLTAQHTGRTMERLVAENSRLVRAQATPVLQFTSGNVGEGGSGRELSLTMSNVGTGTARVIWFELTRDGRVRRDANDLIDYVPLSSEQDYVPTQPVGGTYMPAGEARPFMRWRYPGGAASRSKWEAFDRDRLAGRVTGSACFCSVLGECWTSRLKADMPQPVASCDARGRTSFGG